MVLSEYKNVQKEGLKQIIHKKVHILLGVLLIKYDKFVNGCFKILKIRF